MEMNDPVGILGGLAVVGLIVGIVMYESGMTLGEVVELAAQNPLISVPLGLILLGLVLFGKGGGMRGEA